MTAQLNSNDIVSVFANGQHCLNLH